LDGLNYYAEEIIRGGEYGASLDSRSPLSTIESPDAIPTLLKLLEANYRDDFVQDRFNSLFSSVTNALTNIAVKSSQNYATVKSTIQAFIEENLASNDRVRFLYFYLNTLERTYYTRKSENRSLDEILPIIDRISSISSSQNSHR
jgi:hypothetical protein